MSGKEKTYLCRCEDVTLEDLEEQMKNGVITFEDFKRRTRCCMGPCQGKTCRNLVTQEIAKRTGVSPGEVDVPTYRAISRPIKIGELAGEEEGSHA